MYTGSNLSFIKLYIFTQSKKDNLSFSNIISGITCESYIIRDTLNIHAARMYTYKRLFFYMKKCIKYTFMKMFQFLPRAIYMLKYV